MKAVVFANGILNDREEARKEAESADLILAADGGHHHCLALGIQPDAVVGDMDSLEPRHLQALEAKGVPVHRHPSRKNQTDLELTLQLAASRGADRIVVLGALGARWDMTLANVMLLAVDHLQTASVTLKDGADEIRLVRGGGEEVITGRRGDTVSLIPMGGAARGVTLTGFEYPLTDHTIELGSTLGVSNVLREDRCKVRLESGFLILVVLGEPG